MKTIKHMQEIKNLAKTGNTYLKAYTGFYIFWQFVSILLMIILSISIGVFVVQSKGLMWTFGI